MEPSTNVDGDASSAAAAARTSAGFNGAVDERRRSPARSGADARELNRFNGAVDERRRRRIEQDRVPRRLVGFNGAVDERRRRQQARGLWIPDCPLLQWSRRRTSTETP